jgi:hypothetical protein
MSVCLRDGNARPMTLYFNFMPEAFLFEGFIAERPASHSSFASACALSFETKIASITVPDKLKLNNITPSFLLPRQRAEFAPVTVPH